MTSEANGDLHEYKTLLQPGTRLSESESVADTKGRVFDSRGDGHRHALEPKSSAHQQSARKLAQQLAEELIDARKHNLFQRIVLVAPPTMLGELRKRLDPATKRLVCHELGKEVSSLSAKEIRALLPGIFPALEMG